VETGGYCFDSHTDDDWIQCMELKVRLCETRDNERAVNLGLNALRDERCALLTS
jgi:hypothetical protein